MFSWVAISPWCTPSASQAKFLTVSERLIIISRSTHADKMPSCPITRNIFSIWIQVQPLRELKTFGSYRDFFLNMEKKNRQTHEINHSTSSQQTTHTRSLSIWVSLFIFSKTTYPIAYLPKKRVLGKPPFFLPLHNFRLETTCLLTRNAAKNTPMFNRRFMSTMCNHLLQCLKLTQKKMEKVKLVHLAGIRGKEHGAKDSAMY